MASIKNGTIAVSPEAAKKITELQKAIKQKTGFTVSSKEIVSKVILDFKLKK